MTQPTVLISHFRVKAGAADTVRRRTREVSEQLRAAKPGTLVFLTYLDRAASRFTAVHVFADAAAMDEHFEDADERAREAYAFMEPEGWEIYGPASDAAVATIRQAAEAAGVTLVLGPELAAGFLRLRSG